MQNSANELLRRSDYNIKKLENSRNLFHAMINQTQETCLKHADSI